MSAEPWDVAELLLGHPLSGGCPGWTIAGQLGLASGGLLPPEVLSVQRVAHLGCSPRAPGRTAVWFLALQVVMQCSKMSPPHPHVSI